jgi:hypothetical protein
MIITTRTPFSWGRGESGAGGTGFSTVFGVGACGLAARADTDGFGTIFLRAFRGFFPQEETMRTSIRTAANRTAKIKNFFNKKDSLG